MPYLQDEDLFKDIKQKNIANVYFLYGQEKYFISQAVLQIRKKVVDESFESFNLNKINGEKLDLSEFEDMTDALPVMAEKRCIIIKDLDLEKLAKRDYDKLIEIVKNISPTTLLIIYQDLVLVDMKKSSKYKKFAELIGKNGVVCEFALKDKQTLKRKLCDRARRAYMELDMPTAELLIDRCSSSYMVLINELDKLISYVGEGEITKAHIDECSIKSIDSSAFDLAKSVLSNNFDRAYVLLDELFYQRQEA
ncbi:MAG: DNA polymerase III subunit delta, partial [Oscillospiraceae bacterium]